MTSDSFIFILVFLMWISCCSGLCFLVYLYLVQVLRGAGISFITFLGGRSYLSWDSDLSFSFLKLSRISESFTNLRWLLFLFLESKFLMNCFVLSAQTILLQMGWTLFQLTNIEFLALGLSVRFYLIENVLFFSLFLRIYPSTPFSSRM